jgi:hypothetical protein
MGGGVKDVALSITCYKQTQTQSNWVSNFLLKFYFWEYFLFRDFKIRIPFMTQ